MARQESFTYGTLVIGGGAPTVPAQILDRFGFDETIDPDGNAFVTFVCRFCVTGTGASNLATNCNTVEAALNLYRQKLTMSFGASTQVLYDPDVNAGNTLGFDAAPTLFKLEDATSTGLSRGYLFSVRLMLPVLLAGQDYRRTSVTSLHYDVLERQTVSVSGNYTASPTREARATMLNFIDAFVNARIIAYFGGPLSLPPKEWAITARDEPSNDPNTVASFSRLYSQHVGGRRAETVAVNIGPAKLRIISIQGVYLRTPGAPLSVTAADARTNYIANQPAESLLQLAALIPPLDGELAEITSQSSSYNEQLDRLDFSETWRELLFKQSPAALVLNDPEIISDQVQFFRAVEPLDDSPAPKPVATGTLDLGNAPNGGLSTTTREKSVVFGAPDTVSPSSTAATVRKWVTVGVNYSAYIRNGFNLNDKWTNVLQPYLLGLLSSRLGIAPAFVVSIQPEFDAANSAIKATIIAKGTEGDLYDLKVFDSVNDDLGIRMDPAFTGSPHAYLVQQALPRRTRERRMSAFSKANGGFTLASLASGSQMPGWVKVSEATPAVSRRIIGANVPGVGQLSILQEALVETFVWVGQSVAGTAGDAGDAGVNGGGGGGKNGNGGPGGQGANGGVKSPPSTRATGQTNQGKAGAASGIFVRDK